MKTDPGYASDWFPAMRNLAGLFRPGLTSVRPGVFFCFRAGRHGGFLGELSPMSRTKHKELVQGHPAKGATSAKSAFLGNVWHKS